MQGLLVTVRVDTVTYHLLAHMGACQEECLVLWPDKEVRLLVVAWTSPPARSLVVIPSQIFVGTVRSAMTERSGSPQEGLVDTVQGIWSLLLRIRRFARLLDVPITL